MSAHSGALAAADGAWEALAGAYGLHRVRDLAELADTLELFASGRRAAPGQGIATVHDSGLERAHTADLAAELGVPFAPLTPPTHTRLAAVLDPGLAPANPLDVWGTGRDTEPLFAECLSALAADPAVAAVALAVDLVPEFDGDESYPLAALAAAAGTAKPVAVLAGLPAAVDQDAAARLRAAGIPVLEGTRTGLLALRHLLDSLRPPVTPARPRHPHASPAGDPLPTSGPELFDLLREYGIPVVRTEAAASRDAALAAASAIGYPVVLKTDEPGIAHKSDVGGVRLGLAGPAEARRRLRRPGRPPGPAGGGVRDRRARHRTGAGRRPRSRARSPPGDRGRRRSGRDFGRTGRASRPGYPVCRPGGAAQAPDRPGAGREPRPARRRPRRDRRRHHRPVPPGLRPGRRPRGPRHQPPHLHPRRPHRRRRPPDPPPPAP